MSPKERVLRAIAFSPVGRPPCGTFGTTPAYEERLAAHIGAGSREDMYRLLGIDVWHCAAPLQNRATMAACDIWALFPRMAGVTTTQEVDAAPWPTAADFVGDWLDREVEEHAEFAVVGGINSAVFHIFLAVCGQENALVNLVLLPAVSRAIIGRITDFYVDYLRTVLEVGRGRIDIVENCNDFGTQRSMFVSPETFREFFKPELARLYAVTKEYGARVMQHSCGAVAPIIPDFIELGADILNPIQVSADGMEIGGLARRFGGQIAFYGGIDTQYLLPHGPAEAIRAETRRVLNTFGPAGGLILGGSQGFMDDIPLAHCVAMFEEAKVGYRGPA